MNGNENKEVVLLIRNLYKSFGSNKVLNGFNLALKKGENLAVLGKSGSGKSVLIKCIIGLLYPDEGEITVLGQSIQSLNQDELDHLRVKIGFLFQSNALYDSMTVRENLEFPLRRHWMEVNNTKAHELVMEALENVGLADTVNKMPAELSGGMRKRIALARTLILQPEIILYDEPTTGLDPITSKEISELMNHLQKKYNTSSIIISHDMNCIQRTSDRMILLIDGVAYKEGSFDELKGSDDPVIQPYFE
ncbi:ABC transporter ATP-binding protein [Flavihumibacter sp. UBA7668]|uniref:ABC transporter ATP-binding protein n=1 Tax=Flavihumibacter sp. UBA7668 TaxID=1946542 RepID=UPI0025C35127|nr:ATP-binding cassette domain-containing protein [Flavihumibacter sp. UBA7668]